MSQKTPGDLLYDSEAALRLVDSALEALGESPSTPAGSPNARSSISTASLLELGHREITGILDSLRQSRAVIEKAMLGTLSSTGAKLREVSSATESAANQMLDGIDRATAIVDGLDACDTSTDRAKGAQLRRGLRDELFALVSHLQFQDITSQQLAYVGSVLDEMESRLSALAGVFEVPLQTIPPVAFDPNATTTDRTARQSTADEIVAASARRP